MKETRAKVTNSQLGQVIYLVKREGGIERTMVGALDMEGYHFLNGESDRREHWHTCTEAIAEATERLERKIAEHTAAVVALEAKKARLKSHSYQAEVMASPYDIVDFRAGNICLNRHRVSHPKPPKEYVDPGTLVYAVITPSTRCRDKEVDRPTQPTVIETKVVSVSFSPEGSLHYKFTTPFLVDEFFLSREDAHRHLPSHSEAGTLNPTRYVPTEEEINELLYVDD